MEMRVIPYFTIDDIVVVLESCVQKLSLTRSRGERRMITPLTVRPCEDKESSSPLSSGGHAWTDCRLQVLVARLSNCHHRLRVISSPEEGQLGTGLPVWPPSRWRSRRISPFSITTQERPATSAVSFVRHGGIHRQQREREQAGLGWLREAWLAHLGWKAGPQKGGQVNKNSRDRKHAWR